MLSLPHHGKGSAMPEPAASRREMRWAPCFQPPRLSVLLPAFDEASRLEATVRSLSRTLDGAYPYEYEIVIVDDGSEDATLEAAFDAADRCDRCTVVTYRANAGKGGALRRGLASARGEWVAFFDADGDIAGTDLLSLVDRMERSPELSAVVGRRRWMRRRPWHRTLASNVLARFARLALDLRVPETQAGVKVFVRRDVLRIVPECREDGYLFDLELLARMHRRNLAMASVDLLPLRARPSRIGLRDCLREVVPALRIWWTLVRERPSPGEPAPQLRQPVPVVIAQKDGRP